LEKLSFVRKVLGTQNALSLFKTFDPFPFVFIAVLPSQGPSAINPIFQEITLKNVSIRKGVTAKTML